MIQEEEGRPYYAMGEYLLRDLHKVHHRQDWIFEHLVWVALDSDKRVPIFLNKQDAAALDLTALPEGLDANEVRVVDAINLRPLQLLDGTDGQDK